MHELSVEIRSEAVRHRPLFMRRGIGCDGQRNLPSGSIENRRETPKVELHIIPLKPGDEYLQKTVFITLLL